MFDSIWLVGAGNMAVDYFKVLKDLNLNLKVIGRGSESAKTFEEKTNQDVFVGGLEKALKTFKAPDNIIIAVGADHLFSTLKLVLNVKEVNNILLEKPGSLYKEELLEAQKIAILNNKKVWIAYNRRFYSSVIELKKLVDEEGGITSIDFEFTEWAFEISELKKNFEIKDRWFLANSTHVIDLAFFLIGLPREESFCSYKNGKINWHQSGARFCGAGISQKGIIFSYHADWTSPGRWGLEINTSQSRYILKPLEKLKRIKLGNLNPEEIELENNLDITYKPGLFLQCKEFLLKKSNTLCSLDDQVNSFKFFNKMSGYI